MKRFATGAWMAVGWALLCLLSPSLMAQAVGEATIAAEEKEGCIRNLKIIYAAIQNYRTDHKDIPNWLSDLVPRYINDANVLTCPVCKRTGQTEISSLADPKLPSSYLYEFCPLQLGKGEAPEDPTKTRRDWKRRQMGLVGSIVPIVRCRHHGVVLNLAFDGRIYDSPPLWENLLTNQLDVAELKPARIFSANPGPDGSASLSGYPARDLQAKPNLINLSAYYNAALGESWHGGSRNDLGALPTGVQNLDGVDYDVRGIIQVGSKDRGGARFPARIDGIKIQQKCARLHFLHSAGFGAVSNEGEQVGTYIIHFAINRMQLEIPIIYGRDVRNWHTLAEEIPAPDLTVVWKGTNGVSAAAHNFIRLFSTTWVNPAPGVEIESIDFVSSMGTVAPFLIAITTE